jgi:signal transduction histidine kinase
MLGNIFNNALHAIREKMKLNVAGYQPVITVSTSLSNNRMLISIKDNGTGMTVEVKNQIFNPFFTTKPTGEGAGLGLSISHDIIVAHGGNIVCESEPGKGSVFVISIPIQEE